jgi:hypothetical protein
MRKVVIIAGYLALIVSTCFVYFKVKAIRREARYEQAVTSFRREIPVGRARSEVESYLHQQQISYNEVELDGLGSPASVLVKIGEEEGLACEWDIYVALEFSSSDLLRGIRLRRIGTCL